jgi:hypothetical protein
MGRFNQNGTRTLVILFILVNSCSRIGTDNNNKRLWVTRFKVYEIELTTTLYKSHKYLKLQKFLRYMMANGENSNFEKVDEVKGVEKM